MKARNSTGIERYARVIREARIGANMNQQQLADLIGVSRATVAGWETGHSRPDLDAIPRICKALGISLGSFFGVKEGISREERSLIMTYRAMEEPDKQAILWQAEALLERRRAYRLEKLKDRAIRIYRSELSAAAGFSGTLEAEQGEKVWLFADDRTPRADEIITVNGQSMEPTFQNGDQVLVEHTDRIREGEIGIFLVDGEGFIKEYRKEGLVSHNKAFPMMRFSEGNEIRCLGRVLGKVRDEQWPTESQIELLNEMRL